MSVDMSAEAVTQRLKTLDELWELSVALMRAKPTNCETAFLSERSLGWNSPEEDRARQHLTELTDK
jgi:hypothetical protein